MSTERNLKMSATKNSDNKEATLLKAMASERMSLTCAPGGENHAGMEIIGRMPVKGFFIFGSFCFGSFCL